MAGPRGLSPWLRLLLLTGGLCGSPASAAETLTFSTQAAGTRKAIDEWGYDTAWPSYDNARLSILSFGGTAN